MKLRRIAVLMLVLALALPCVATDCPCGGPAAVIRDGEDGLLIPVGDERALTEKLALLLGDAALRARLSENARRRAESFRPEAVFGQWLDYVQSLTESEKE